MTDQEQLATELETLTPKSEEQKATNVVEEEENGGAKTKAGGPALNVDASFIYGKNKTYPIMLTADEHSTINPRTFWKEKNKATGNCRKVVIRLIRTLVVVFIPVILLLILRSIHGEMRVSTFIGLMIWCYYGAYYIAFFLIFCSGLKKGQNLFRIISVNAKAPVWTNMSITTHQVIFPYISIGSISEFSAILGGIPNVLLNSITAYTWALLMTHYAVQLVIYGEKFSFDSSDTCIIIGSIGLLLIGIFEIGYVHWIQAQLHVAGVFLSGMIFIGYALQQHSIRRPNWWISLIIFAIGSILFVTWKIVRYYAELLNGINQEKIIDENKLVDEKLRKSITKQSVINVGTEAAMMVFVSLALGLWFLDYDQICERGCCCDPIVLAPGQTWRPTTTPTAFPTMEPTIHQ